MAAKYRQNNEQLHANIQSVSNPINAFRLIKRLANAWKELQAEMRSEVAHDYLQNISSGAGPRFPTDVGIDMLLYNQIIAFQEDLNGAAVGLLRLQDTYRLDTRDLANGIVKDVKISNEMTGS